jgi:peptidoglycan/LPS O-acetylase OafA/YrhL
LEADSRCRWRAGRLAAGESSDATARHLARLNAVVRQYLGGTSAPDQVGNVARAQYQLDRAADEGMAPLLWALLLGGCVLLLLMAALLSMEKARHHAIGSVLLGGALGAAVFLILAADHPFSGPLRVMPGDLVQDLHAYAIMDDGNGTSP